MQVITVLLSLGEALIAWGPFVRTVELFFPSLSSTGGAVLEGHGESKNNW